MLSCSKSAVNFHKMQVLGQTQIYSRFSQFATQFTYACSGSDNCVANSDSKYRNYRRQKPRLRKKIVLTVVHTGRTYAKRLLLELASNQLLLKDPTNTKKGLHFTSHFGSKIAYQEIKPPPPGEVGRNLRLIISIFFKRAESKLEGPEHPS